MAETLITSPVAAGDSEAAQQRLAVIESLPLLETTEEAIALAKDLIRIGPSLHQTPGPVTDRNEPDGSRPLYVLPESTDKHYPNCK